MPEVSIMVLSTGTGDEAPPQFFVERKGVWRDTPLLRSGSFVSFKETRDIVDQQLNNLMLKVGQAINSGNDLPNFTFHLKRVFWGVYSNIVPFEIQNALQQALAAAKKLAEETGAEEEVPILRIHFSPQVEWIPWEVMHDGTDYLGLQFQIARLPIVAGGPDLNGDQIRYVNHIYNLLGQNVLSPSPDPLFMAWRKTFDGLTTSAQQEIQCPAREDNNWPTVDKFVEAVGADILHLTCHGGLKDKRGQVYWTLNDKAEWPEQHRIYPDSVRMLSNLRSAKTLVFGNACASIKGTASDAREGSEGGLTPGLGSAFFAQGAPNFVGTFAPTTKKVAIEFARQFYQRLFQENMSIGKALWATKKYYQDKEEHDPSWLYYCLYGLPETCFEIAR
jgi:CHAT domain-containing protein